VLASVQIRDVTIVVGYKQEMIRAAVGTQHRGVGISYLVNEEFHRGSISSLWIARSALSDDVVIMDADVLFHREILRRLVTSPFTNCLLMDDTVKQTGEECMVVVSGGRVIALSKKVPERYDVAGEGVGFLKVRRADTAHVIGSVKAYIDQGRWDMEYEDGLLQYFQDVKVGHEKIGGLPWTEIDFPEDITRAEREVLPRL
jgi:L-glutamine-phosphate cytidylyltransferase